MFYWFISLLILVKLSNRVLNNNIWTLATKVEHRMYGWFEVAGNEISDLETLQILYTYDALKLKF